MKRGSPTNGDAIDNAIRILKDRYFNHPALFVWLNDKRAIPSSGNWSTFSDILIRWRGDKGDPPSDEQMKTLKNVVDLPEFWTRLAAASTTATAAACLPVAQGKERKDLQQAQLLNIVTESVNTVKSVAAAIGLKDLVEVNAPIFSNDTKIPIEERRSQYHRALVEVADKVKVAAGKTSANVHLNNAMAAQLRNLQQLVDMVKMFFDVSEAAQLGSGICTTYLVRARLSTPRDHTVSTKADIDPTMSRGADITVPMEMSVDHVPSHPPNSDSIGYTPGVSGGEVDEDPFEWGDENQ